MRCRAGAHQRTGGRRLLTGRAVPGRVAVVAGPDPGHALPALGVAAELARRGHEVRVLSGEGHDATARSVGLEVERLPLLAPQAGDRDLGHRLWERAAQMAVPLADLLRPWAPQLLVVDTLTRAGAFAAQLLGCHWAEVIPHHLPDPAVDLPPVGLGRRPARTPWRRADDRHLVARQRRSWQQGMEEAVRAAERIGLEALQPPRIRLVATLPSLERARSRWPTDAHVVGPLALDPLLPSLVPPDGDDPLVVVSDSTATGVRDPLGEVARRALAHLDLRVVITTAGMSPVREPRLVVGRGAHSPLFARASLVVTSGGGGVVSKALAAGVPLVVVPVQGDQREAAARVRDTGAGRSVAVGRLTPRRLRWVVVRHLADDRARAAAGVLAAEAAQLGVGLAVELLEEVLDGRRPRSTGPRHHLAAAAESASGTGPQPGRRTPMRPQ